MIWRAFLLWLTFASTTMADTPLDSLDLRTETLGLEAVGKIDHDGRGFCTGVLVDNDLVLTAAHCLFEEGERIDPRKLSFHAGMRHGEAVATSAVRRAVVMAEYRHDDTDALRELLNDVALLQLVDRIPLATAAPFQTSQSVARGDAVSVVSYARTRAGTLSRQDRCRVTDRGVGALALSCDVDFGSSGAPVFRANGSREQIVSIISRFFRDGDETIALGMEVAPALAQLRKDMIEGRGVFPKEEVKGRAVKVGDGRAVGRAKFLRP